jgi:hypothetical protein
MESVYVFLVSLAYCFSSRHETRAINYGIRKDVGRY